MTTREKRLGILFLATLLIGGVIAIDTALSRSRTNLSEQNASLQDQLNTQETLLQYRDSIQADRQQLQQILSQSKDQGITNHRSAQGQLSRQCYQLARQQNLQIIDQELLESAIPDSENKPSKIDNPHALPTLNHADYSITVQGDSDAVIQFLAQLRQPQKLQAPISIQLQPNSQRTLLEASATIRRIYPVGSDQSR